MASAGVTTATTVIKCWSDTYRGALDSLVFVYLRRCLQRCPNRSVPIDVSLLVQLVFGQLSVGRWTVGPIEEMSKLLVGLANEVDRRPAGPVFGVAGLEFENSLPNLKLFMTCWSICYSFMSEYLSSRTRSERESLSEQLRHLLQSSASARVLAVLAKTMTLLLLRYSPPGVVKFFFVWGATWEARGELAIGWDAARTGVSRLLDRFWSLKAWSYSLPSVWLIANNVSSDKSLCNLDCHTTRVEDLFHLVMDFVVNCIEEEEWILLRNYLRLRSVSAANVDLVKKTWTYQVSGLPKLDMSRSFHDVTKEIGAMLARFGIVGWGREFVAWEEAEVWWAGGEWSGAKAMTVGRRLTWRTSPPDC